MNLLVANAAGLTGYLVGGISFARIVAGHLPTAELAVRMDFSIMRSLSRKRYAEIDALSRGSSCASQPAARADQLPGAAS